jgi:hypothetical protein
VGVSSTGPPAALRCAAADALDSETELERTRHDATGSFRKNYGLDGEAILLAVLRTTSPVSRLTTYSPRSRQPRRPSRRRPRPNGFCGVSQISVSPCGARLRPRPRLVCTPKGSMPATRTCGCVAANGITLPPAVQLISRTRALDTSGVSNLNRSAIAAKCPGADGGNASQLSGIVS